MIIDLKDYCSKLRKDNLSIARYWCFLENNAPIEELSNEAIKPLKEGQLPPSEVQCNVSSNLTLKVKYNADTSVCAIKNVDLSRLVDAYAVHKKLVYSTRNYYWSIMVDFNFN